MRDNVGYIGWVQTFLPIPYSNRDYHLSSFHSGVTQVLARARGLIVTAWLVMTVISVHAETRVAVVSVPPRPSSATVSVSSVMATAAASRLALGLSTASALVGSEVRNMRSLISERNKIKNKYQMPQQ